MDIQKNQIILDKKKTLSALVALAVLLPSCFGVYKYAKNNHVVDKIFDSIEYDHFYNNPFIALSKAKENGESFASERKIVSSDLLKAKENKPNKSYLQLLTQMEQDIISEYGSTTDEQRKLYMITHHEIYQLLRMTPEKDQQLMILGYMNRKDTSIMDYSTEDNFVNYPEIKRQSQNCINSAMQELQKIVLRQKQTSRN